MDNLSNANRSGGPIRNQNPHRGGHRFNPMGDNSRIKLLAQKTFTYLSNFDLSVTAAKKDPIDLLAIRDWSQLVIEVKNVCHSQADQNIVYQHLIRPLANKIRQDNLEAFRKQRNEENSEIIDAQIDFYSSGAENKMIETMQTVMQLNTRSSENRATYSEKQTIPWLNKIIRGQRNLREPFMLPRHLDFADFFEFGWGFINLQNDI